MKLQLKAPFLLHLPILHNQNILEAKANISSNITTRTVFQITFLLKNNSTLSQRKISNIRNRTAFRSQYALRRQMFPSSAHWGCAREKRTPESVYRKAISKKQPWKRRPENSRNGMPTTPFWQVVFANKLQRPREMGELASALAPKFQQPRQDRKSLALYQVLLRLSVRPMQHFDSHIWLRSPLLSLESCSLQARFFGCDLVRYQMLRSERRIDYQDTGTNICLCIRWLGD